MWDDDIEVLKKPKRMKPSYIGDYNDGNGGEKEEEERNKQRSFAAWIRKKRKARQRTRDEIASYPDGALARSARRRASSFHETDQYVRDGGDTLEYIETEALLALLPGFRGGSAGSHGGQSACQQEER